jgi:hypothetical protein
MKGYTGCFYLSFIFWLISLKLGYALSFLHRFLLNLYPYITSVTFFTSSAITSLQVTSNIARHHFINEAADTQIGEYLVRLTRESAITAPKHITPVGHPNIHAHIKQNVSTYILTSRSPITGHLGHGRGCQDQRMV